MIDKLTASEALSRRLREITQEKLSELRDASRDIIAGLNQERSNG